MSIFSISDWFRRPTKATHFFSIFHKIGESFSYNELSDERAVRDTLCSSAFYSVVRTAAEGVASIPLKLVVQRGEEFEEVTEGDVYDFIFHPNQDETLSEYWEGLSYYYFINGEFFSYMDREAVGFMDGGLVSLPPELITVNTSDRTSILSQVESYRLMDGAKTRTIMPEDMLHVKMINPTVQGRRNKNGLSPLQAGQQILNASINLDTALSWYFENRGASTLISGTGASTGMTLKPEDKENIRRATRQNVGGAHRMNGIEVVDAPVTATQLNASSTDMQMIQNYNLVVERLSALIDLPAILVQVNVNSTYNNVQEAKKQAYTELYIPTAEKFIRGYDRTYLAEWNAITGQNYKLIIDEQAIKTLQPDPTEHRRQVREDVRAGILTRNEARQEIGKETINLEEMNVPTVQNNLVPIQNVSNEE